jgi:uncharacterized membrane protein YciS (DUF1049 family)
MRAVSLILLLVVFGAVVALGTQNEETVTLTFFTWSLTTQLWAVVAGGYVLGTLSGWAFASVLKRSWRRVVEPRRS